MKTESNGRAEYFVVYVDKSSRWCEVRFINSKSEITGKKTRKVITLLKNQKNKMVKGIQYDKRTEYLVNFDNMLKEKVITRSLTVPQNLEQNGIAIYGVVSINSQAYLRVFGQRR